MINMAREYLPKLAIAILAVSVALIIVSAQPTPVAALSNPQNSTEYHHHNWWGYYYYYYYPSYYSSSYCPSNSNYYGYPYY